MGLGVFGSLNVKRPVYCYAHE